MRIYFDNYNPTSSSGPNSFGSKLSRSLKKLGHEVTLGGFGDVQLSFIQTSSKRCSKVVLRLDGIYFNTRQDWRSLNAEIEKSHGLADCVIYQSDFNRRLAEHYFGPAKSHRVIGNGTIMEAVSDIPALDRKTLGLDRFSEIWCCSSSWRPHKRLKANIEYFLAKAPPTAGLVVLGENPDFHSTSPRVVYAGKVSWPMCIAFYKTSKVFLHLAFLDHCPNVVVDASACGCQVVVSSSGGTKEVAGPDASVVKDLDWDFSPLDLYDPPPLDFDDVSRNGVESSIDIDDVARKYIDAFRDVISLP